MLHAGLDLGRTRLDYCLLDEAGDRVEVGAAPPDGDGLRGFARRVELRHGPVEVHAAIESMNGARFVHDTLEREGWEVEVADAQKVKGLGPLACKTDRIDAWVLAELSRRDLVPAIWLPSFELRAERERARWRLFLVRKRSSLKHRVHAQLLAFGHRCPVSDLFGRRGRELLARLDFPDPWRDGVLASVAMIDDLDRQIAGRGAAKISPKGALALLLCGERGLCSSLRAPDVAVRGRCRRDGPVADVVSGRRRVARAR